MNYDSTWYHKTKKKSYRVIKLTDIRTKQGRNTRKDENTRER